MDFLKVRTVGFAIRNRLLGYELLKNPKGRSPYEVKMIKKWNGINGETLDRYEHYYTKSRDFSKPGTKTEKETMLVTKYMFWKNKDDKKILKETIYMKDRADGSSVYKQKSASIDYEEIYNRNTDYINERNHKVLRKTVRTPFLQPIRFEYGVIKESISDREIDKFFEEQRKNKPQKESFWKTLIRNLKGEG